jgi:hypothetical protein
MFLINSQISNSKSQKIKDKSQITSVIPVIWDLFFEIYLAFEIWFLDSYLGNNIVSVVSTNSLKPLISSSIILLNTGVNNRAICSPALPNGA